MPDARRSPLWRPNRLPGLRAHLGSVHGRARARAPATERELNILVAHLEASLLADHSLDFEHAIAEHRKLVASQSAERPTPRPAPRSGERVRPREHDPREGWAWLRVFRRLDDYERALSRVQAEREGLLAEHAELGTQERERASVWSTAWRRGGVTRTAATSGLR